MRALLAILTLCVIASASAKASADEPLPVPEYKTICSHNGFFCALMDPEKKETTVVRRRAGGITERLWSLPGWFRVAYIANDGDHLVTGYDGMNLLPQNYRKDQVMLTFYEKGKILRQVRLNEMIKDFSKMEKTASHYQWGNYLGINDNDHLTVELPGKQWMMFDARTGKEIK